MTSPPAYSERAPRMLAEALRFDPFYAAISAQFVPDEGLRHAALARYFAYSMAEGDRLGRLVLGTDEGLAAAIWALPVDPRIAAMESAAKHEFLVAALGALGADTYHRIVDFMKPRAAAVADASAWYLSILGVAPAAQGRGIGARLLEPTLAEADAAGVDCYLETFDDRNPRFYEKLGFCTVASHAEPVTATSYRIMVRQPRPAASSRKFP